MEKGKKESVWERTNVTNLLRNRASETYYARVKVNGKQKWRSLETTLFSVAKLKLGDTEKEIRAQALTQAAEARPAGAEEMIVGHFIGIFRQRTADDPKLKPNSKLRREISIKAVLTTWPDFPTRDVRRVTPTDSRHRRSRISVTLTSSIDTLNPSSRRLATASLWSMEPSRPSLSF